MNHSSILCVALVTVALLSACSPSKIDRSHLVGNWHLKDGAASTVVFALAIDGTFKAVGVPAEAIPDWSGPANISGTGRWAVVEKRGKQLVEIEWEALRSPNSTTVIDGTLRDSTPIMIGFPVGDPDDYKHVWIVKSP